ncbi:hypothetical protein Ga0609869_003588 [Rhodovulum iodosum]|uniref:Sulfotransferase family protein n=1 Tax=Rhodovulum iodosum TaxID=68291 RepID=A0ABV3XXY2_9RHOB|nr:hypothetical protein [Rhodovulum robiginosum]RSK38870.1 hypothetical protein EJA01_01600 [Rhodovulum robiginosum]
MSRIERALRRAVRRMRYDPAMKFQVVGERCSGTNFAHHLIRANVTNNPCQAYGWKHGFPLFIAAPRDVVFVVMFREALPWLKSMYQKPWHSTEALRALAFSDFIRAEWDATIDKPGWFALEEDDKRAGLPLQYDRNPLDGSRFANILEMRGMKMRAMLGLKTRGAKVVFRTHAELTQNPEALIEELAGTFGLSRKPGFTVPEGHFGWVWNERKAWLGPGPIEISDADMAFIDSQIDPALERAAGLDWPPQAG